MKKRMFFNFFVMNTPSHIFHGAWRHPNSRSVDYNDLDLWVEVARLAEKARIDAIFFADVFGMYEEFGGSRDPIVRNAVQFPISDPAVLLSAMAHATEHLGFIYTNSVLQQHPFAFARAASTLDHLTKGRLGWNIVTSASKNGSRSMGLETIVDHDERYRWAEEYCEVAYKLWEGSWEDDAVLRDRVHGLYADPAKVHQINHVGRRYSVEGPHLVEPSPQRTPMLFQAGSSPAGQAFAARHTEGSFYIAGSPEICGTKIKALKALAREAGRQDDDIISMEGLAFVVGSTEAEARRKDAEIEDYLSDEGQMVMVSGASGIDLAKTSPDTPLKDIVDHAPGMRDAVQGIINAAPPGMTATVRDLLQASSRRFRFVGTPETIADRIEEYGRAGVDGIQIMNILLPDSFRDFAEHVVPVLQKRGIMQTDYRPGTLRQKFFAGRGPRLVPPHPACRHRR